MVQITQETYNKLAEELEDREKVKRKEIADRIKEAKELGDLSENAAYKEAQEEAALNESQIQKLREKLASAEIIQDDSKKKGVARVGSIVKVQKQGQKQEHQFEIVDSDEADPAEGKISFSSPLGEALTDSKKGDTVEVATPGGKVKYTILEVS